MQPYCGGGFFAFVFSLLRCALILTTAAMRVPVILTIAGFDPSSGAGVTADVKTLAAHGCYGLACITAMTVQSTRGVKRFVPLSPALVSDVLAELFGDFEIDAVKIGMLGSAPVARAVLRFLERNRPHHVVLDPVMRSSSGASLMDRSGLGVVRRILPLAEVITPNAREAVALSGIPHSLKPSAALEHLRAAALRLHELGAVNVVITGGDMKLASGKVVDLVSMAEPTVPMPARRTGTTKGIRIRKQQPQGKPTSLIEELAGPRVQSRNTHGTGCAFASAIAANLARGCPLRQAIVEARQYVVEAIRTAPALGHGHGPLNHFARQS